jgi:hypothetical protein
MRLPQSGQKVQSLVLPLSPRVCQTDSFPRVSSKSSLAIHTDVPKALDDCFWQSVQWQA